MGEGAALPALGAVCPSAGLAPASTVGGLAAIYGGASWKLEEAESWNAATLGAAGSMRKLQLSSDGKTVRNLDVHI